MGDFGLGALWGLYRSLIRNSKFLVGNEENGLQMAVAANYRRL